MMEVAEPLRNRFPESPGPRLGDKVIEVENLTKSFGERTLIDDLSFSIPKGAIVGIIGPNGAGKSTLFKMLNGVEQPDGGNVTLGETVSLASVGSERIAIRSNATVASNPESRSRPVGLRSGNS